MAVSRARRPERRGEPLSRERIVEAAIGLLDESGEGGLTFRALARRLATGPGALYWHVSGKDELLGAATDAAVADAMTAATAGATPREAVRALAVGVFDAIDAHPWIGAQLARSPGRSRCCGSSSTSGARSRHSGCPTRPGSPPRPRC